MEEMEQENERDRNLVKVPGLSAIRDTISI